MGVTLMINKIVKRIIKNEDLQQNKARERLAKISGIIGIMINSFLFILKGLLGLFTGSISLIADAFNHLGDTASSIITIIGFKIAGKEPDREHPYGHGRVEYLTGLSVSVLIIIAVLMQPSKQQDALYTRCRNPYENE